ncbi:hypothetical protein BDA96_10G166000 [Sorghum bicolor]|uniref:Uncharacterized protein n=1 Tax=Sorghum bicolor TaxID=4558 RepID=A0A921Q4E4_SORBI|nr:hypothetical protein BDA96_10G166000 [Sorghum bicolor]KAG0514156.1 hypothetical protein BDA96_10G166000 [Sorghum bicolor]
MCLPFCCRENDPPQPQVTHEHHTGHGVEHVDHPPPSGTGKGSDNGNGANMNKNNGDEDKSNMAKSPPTPAPQQSPDSDTEDEEVPSASPTPAAPQTHHSPLKHRHQKTEEASVAATTPVPTVATKAPKKAEQVVASPRHHAGSAVAAAGVADSARTPPEMQVARRGQAHQGDYGYPNPSASATVVAVPPAANNVRGDRGHGDGALAHAYGGKDDRKTPGRTSRQ